MKIISPKITAWQDIPDDQHVPTEKLVKETFDSFNAILFVSPPMYSGSTGSPGNISYDIGYFYICTSSNVWKRIPLSW
jgi:hypothetical protein